MEAIADHPVIRALQSEVTLLRKRVEYLEGELRAEHEKLEKLEHEQQHDHEMLEHLDGSTSYYSGRRTVTVGL